LINAIKRECNHEIIIPGKTIIDFKEALIFAFMGVLKNLGKVNCLASVTGAKQDCSGGIEYLI
jgi:anhydro-N-acetylmuramic acid kinase